MRYECLNKKEKLLVNNMEKSNFQGVSDKEYFVALAFLINKYKK